MRRLTRRALVRGAGAAGVLALAGCDTRSPRGGLLGVMERWNAGVQAALFSPGRQAGDQPLTPEDAFPAYHAGHDTPPVAPAGWRLALDGRVARPRTLTLDDLVGLPRVDYQIEHHCVEGWSAVARWTGVRVSDLAELCGAADVDYVEFRSFEGYWSSWDRDSAMHPQTILAYAMNDRPLAPAHGRARAWRCMPPLRSATSWSSTSTRSGSSIARPAGTGRIAATSGSPAPSCS